HQAAHHPITSGTRYHPPAASRTAGRVDRSAAGGGGLGWVPPTNAQYGYATSHALATDRFEIA
ncbi:hypothetical protein, partial [Pseudovibrio sp. POLY-S9]|uniref:hypothetical protein n=1 Tax=Pseudovibrio sp. POLY-S9 TaxID=1576596 RepID=UPI001AD90689